MENRIPIDELFHDKLSRGSEQMNLGAWANMERMLDGKNPYATEEEKKRRGLIPLFFILLLGIGVTGAGYYVYTTTSNQSHEVTATSSPNSQSQSFEATNKMNYEFNHTNSSDNIESQASTSEIAKPNSDNQSNSSSKQALNNLNNSNNHSSVAQSSVSSIASTQSKQTKSLNTSSNNKIGSLASNHKTTKNANQQEIIDQATANNSSSDLDQTQPKFGKKHKAPSMSLAHTNDKNQDNQQADNNNLNQFASPSKTIKEVTSMPAVKIASKEVRNNDGSIQSILHDTMETSVYEKVTEKSAPINLTANLDPMATNPRYKILTGEEEQNARYRSEENIKQIEPTVVASNTEPASNSVASHSDISLESNQRKSATHTTGYFEDLRKFFLDTYTKVSNFMMYSPKPNWYTGLNMGVNMSMSNSQNNFGGFQGGFSALTPINDYFSFVTELKFYYRKNGGYTANDISYNIINQTKDTASILHNTIYSYTKDSTVKTYNIKNFYSLELPLMAQLNIRSLSFYGGVNLAYGFKLKTTDKSRNYKTDYLDTLPTGAFYSFPAEKGMVISRDDFSSRFGIGYTVGAAYSFSPQLHIDVRVTQNVWDNMKTNAAREISNGYFKVPSIQLGLGYRFRKFTPGD